MEQFESVTFPVIVGVSNTIAIDRTFRRNALRVKNEGFQEGKYVSVLSDVDSGKIDGVTGVSELASHIANNVSITLFGYTFFPKIHRPILLMSRNVPEHKDIDHPEVTRRELGNSIRTPGDALSILVPLKRETDGSNVFTHDSDQELIDWSTSPHRAIVFDQTKFHGIDGDELKMFWVALVHRKLYGRIRLFAEKMDKIMKKI